MLLKRLSHVTICLLAVVLYYTLIGASSSSNRTIRRQYLKKSIVPLFFQHNATFNTDKKNLCRWLKDLKHQNKLCLKQQGLAEILLEAKKLIVGTCRTQFQYEQWNCLNVKKFFKKVYRETAYMYALSASGLMFLIAKSCALGKLDSCKCASHGKSKSPDWEWGGCGDNTKYAKSFTNKFLQLNKRRGDTPNSILKYDIVIGISVVLTNEIIHCKCFGVSGSCSTKICWKKLLPFSKIGSDLKLQYHSAIQAETGNTNKVSNTDNMMSKLIYLENSPNFCPSTVGRRCQNENNCATLCCGRGADSKLENLKERCNCTFDNNYILHCNKCDIINTLYTCK